MHDIDDSLPQADADGFSTAANRDVILDSISEGVFTVDREWRITSFNRAAELLTGVSREEAIGNPCSEVFRASICEGSCALKEALAQGTSVAKPLIYILDVDGNRIPIRISAAVLRDRQDRAIGGVETFQDLRQVEELRRRLEAEYSFADIIGRSPAMIQLFDILPQIAENDSNVLIEGASGTGKELFARAIHKFSHRSDKPLITVNCGALPDSLLESELFGHKAGAFTGARTSRPGRFAVAEGGTLFLDEISAISPAMQVRLLRVLQEHTYEPLGSDVPVRTDVRIVTATNEDLSELVRRGTFRQDLYYRIHVIHLELPSLAKRREDIPLLIDHFVGGFNRLQGKDVSGISPAALAALMDYDYPGNVRELENLIECAFVFASAGLIDLQHLPPAFRTQPAPGLAGSAGSLSLKATERILVVEALEKHKGNRTLASEELGINVSTLYRKLKSYGIDVPEGDGRRRKA
jgi:PAS domain S-box-containing protein